MLTMLLTSRTTIDLFLAEPCEKEGNGKRLRGNRFVDVRMTTLLVVVVVVVAVVAFTEILQENRSQGEVCHFRKIPEPLEQRNIGERELYNRLLSAANGWRDLSPFQPRRYIGGLLDQTVLHAFEFRLGCLPS